LQPVYKDVKAAEEGQSNAIELVDMPAAAPEAETKSCESKCDWESKCKNRRCCGTAEESRGKRCVRCVAVTMSILFVLWVVAGTVTVGFLGIKAHRCLHPHHVEVVQYSFSPETIKKVELGLIAGKVTIRSCPHAKNVSLTVRNYASTSELLDTMNVMTTIDDTTGVHFTAVAAPSFDWRHCQHTWIELVVPQKAELDVQARGMFSFIEVEADAKALRNVHISSKVGGVSIEHTHVSGAITIDHELGFIKVKDSSVQEALTTRQSVGYVGVHDVEAANIDTAVRIGHACVGNVDSPAMKFNAEVGYAGMYNVNATKLTAHVEYGKLSVQALAEFEGHFSVVSPYGFLSVDAGAQAPHVVYAQNDDANIDGTIASKTVPITSGVIVSTKQARDFSLTSVSGAVDFFIPNPHSAWWHKKWNHN